MIFGGSLDESQWRYRSREAAEAGHAAALALVRASVDSSGSPHG
jgi:hypothetical protein